MLHDDRSIHRFSDSSFAIEADRLALEVLVELKTTERILTRLLATPHDIEHLTVGHLFLEHDLDITPEQLVLKHLDNGTVSVLVNGLEGTTPLYERPSVVTSSCGACDHPHLHNRLEVDRAGPPSSDTVSMEQLTKGFQVMRSRQPGFEATGGMHAALLLDQGENHIICEDIGRHNAVDKAWGSWRSEHRDRRPRALLLSGRVGWDVVAKAARMGVHTIASVGAASTMAADTARSHNITLVSFWKPHSSVVIGRLEGLNDTNN